MLVKCGRNLLLCGETQEKFIVMCEMREGKNFIQEKIFKCERLPPNLLMQGDLTLSLKH